MLLSEDRFPALSPKSLVALAKGPSFTILETEESPHLRLVKTNPIIDVASLSSFVNSGLTVRKNLGMSVSTAFFTLTPILAGETHSGWYISCPNLMRESGKKFISACTKGVLASVGNEAMLKKAGGFVSSPVGLPDPVIAFLDKDLAVFESEGLASVLVIVDHQDSRI